ncbi:ribosomal-protein-alanine N-acetyltransferase [Heliobacillus mobilis]|uniref:Ribosomal-protein-alanine N-acetyltransferase n=1 Tax=Heliobacterium mobile TaxID=28064 RepID=A0A6I3SJJ3_HELMO|nr:ribosomal protein S18-alanine N-acetyltransferase [Heliobacterium mobile]MTV48945.1 ribosomal-protein-alanine N-acetyltransferase [Heliobacterium mobile]
MRIKGGKVSFRPMTIDDLDAVMEIECQSFPTPWSRSSFVLELTESSLSHYWVCLFYPETSPDLEQGRVIGYAGTWAILDEVHITTIAIHRDWRGKGLGEALLNFIFLESILKGGERITLEVRPSNESAIALYRKMGFQDVGRRRGYYTDTGEDAIIMWRDLRKPEGEQQGKAGF